MDHRDRAGAMGMGVLDGRRAVGGPAGVADPDRPGAGVSASAASSAASLPGARTRRMRPAASSVATPALS
jgi:hypothetical protein